MHLSPPRANGPPPRGLNGPQAGRFASARLPELVTIPRPMCGAAKEVIPAHVSGLPCPGSAFDPGSGARREAMRIFRHPGWSMVMVGFLGLTAHGQEGAQVQNNSAPAAANAVAATANGQITEKDVKEVFDKNPEIFDGSMVRARHILLTPPAGDAAAAEQAKQQLERDKQQIENEVAQGLAKLPATADAITRERERA